MAQLARPPGLPSPLEGILNLGGAPVAVLRLDRLFGLPAQQLRLHSALIVLKGVAEGKVAVLADQVNGIFLPAEGAPVTLSESQSFNGCADEAVRIGGDLVELLAPSRILMASERESLGEFRAMAQRRLAEWKQETA
jgi:purine-binding chemotaxis protein CheW